MRELRRRGYDAFAAGNSVPRSFSAGSPPPLPGDPPPAGPVPSPGVDGLLSVWIEEYWENSLCGWEGPKYLTMGAVAVLYAGSPPREVWRARARTAEQGDYLARNLIWLTTTRLSDGVLATFPAGPGWRGAALMPPVVQAASVVADSSSTGAFFLPKKYASQMPTS